MLRARVFRKLIYFILATSLLFLIYALYNFSGKSGNAKFQKEENLASNDESESRSRTIQLRSKTDEKNRLFGSNEQAHDPADYDEGPPSAGDSDGGGQGVDGKGPSIEEIEGDPDREDLQNELAEVDLDVTPTIPTTKESRGTTVKVQSLSNVLGQQKFTGPRNTQQKMIVDAFLHAWNGYRKYAWGMDELKPLSRSGQQWMGVGLTIVDSLDTVIIMGLNDEYQMARDWIANHLNFEFDGDVQLFEMTIRTLGGLLSAYHLTSDELFLNKAIELGYKFSSCFNGITKIPCSRLNMKRVQPTFAEISTAESGSIQLEFRDLARSSNESKFEDQVGAISDHLHGLQKLDGLVSCFLNPVTGSFQPASSVSVGASADSYYEYLLKQWIQTGKKTEWLKSDYLEAVEGMRKHLLRFSEPSKLAFVGALPNAVSVGQVRNEMEHLSCFLPGTLALGTIHGIGLDRGHLELASNLAKTCWTMYDSMPTKLSPEIAVMNIDPNIKTDISTQYNTRYNLQRPETVESLFYLYRATNNSMYRDWAWKIFLAFETYTKVESGYASIDNVEASEKPGHKDKMETFYLAETLKYLYLLFSDDLDLLPLEKYVMNTEAHPLPVYFS